MGKFWIVLLMSLALTACGPDKVKLAEQASIQAGQAGIEAGHRALGEGFQAVGDLAQAETAIANSNTAALQVAAKSIDAAMKAAGWAFWSSTMTNILLFIVMVAFISLAAAFVWYLFKNVVAPMAAQNAQLTGRAYDRLEPPPVSVRQPRDLAKRRDADLVERRRR